MTAKVRNTDEQLALKKKTLNYEQFARWRPFCGPVSNNPE